MARSRVSQALDGPSSPAREARSVKNWQQTLRLPEPHRYRAGSELFSAGSPASDVFLLANGVVGLYYSLPDSQDALFMLGYPGFLLNDFIPEPSLTGPVSALALTACQAYRLSIPQLEDAAQRDPAVASLLQRSMKVQISRRTTALVSLLSLSPLERLEHHLCELASVMGEVKPGGSARVKPPLKDEQLAMLLGISLRQFKRVKKELQATGRVRIEDNKTVFIENC